MDTDTNDNPFWNDEKGWLTKEPIEVLNQIGTALENAGLKPIVSPVCHRHHAQA